MFFLFQTFISELKSAHTRDWRVERTGLVIKDQVPGAFWWGNSQWSPEGFEDQKMLHWFWPYVQQSPLNPLSSCTNNCVFLGNTAWSLSTCHMPVDKGKEGLLVTDPRNQMRYLESETWAPTPVMVVRT